ncbi:MAG: phosphopantetheine-binding protein [Planctomycetaceae bacterium]|nr:phosphopantetheine-binding protein [Planctomycetaceae bacterium]
MTESELQSLIVQLLGEIAPEIDPKQIQPDINLREQLDLDSMDFQNFVIALHEHTHVDVPERDYAKLQTLSGAVAYLKSRLPSD